jgi:colanic acid biosynthesis glycosyl transferase WcaI
MAVGRPILMAVKGDAADLVAQAGCGVCCEPEQPWSIAEGVERLAATAPNVLRRMGQNGRDFYFRTMCLDVGVRQFEGLFESVVR